MIFVDLTRVFDTVSHDGLSKIMTQICFDANQRRFQTKSKVQTEGFDELLYTDDMAKNASSDRTIY